MAAQPGNGTELRGHLQDININTPAMNLGSWTLKCVRMLRGDKADNFTLKQKRQQG